MFSIMLVLITAAAIGCWAEFRKQVSGIFWMMVTMGVWLVCWVLLLLSQRSGLLSPFGSSARWSSSLHTSAVFPLADVAVCALSAALVVVLLSSFPDSEGDLP